MAADTEHRLSFRCPALAFFVAVLSLSTPRISQAIRYGQMPTTLHFGKEFGNVDLTGSPFLIDVNDFADRIDVEEVDGLGSPARDAPFGNRVKRGADGTPPAESRIKVTKFQLNDSHTQLIVHWAGEGSDVILALARYNHDGGTSSLFVSQDYGRTFRNMGTELGNVSLHRYYNSPIYNSHYIFTDIQANRIYTSRNFGLKFLSYQLSFKPRTVALHATNPNIILAMDDMSSDKKLYISHDFGASWRVMQTSVKSFFWGVEPWDVPNTLYVEREEWTDNSVVLKSTNFFQTSRVLIRGVVDFEVRDNYMFATKKLRLFGSRKPVSLQLWVSRNRRTFQRAVFPGALQELDYYVADASEDQVFVCVNHNHTASHLYISDQEGLRYSLSLTNVIYFNPNGSNNDTWLRLYKDESFADIHKVDGLRGVYIASQLKNHSLSLENQVSFITFDKGGLWQPLLAPQKDSEGNPTNCDQSKQCSLHLSQEFSKLYPGSKTVPILSKKSAPGLILASGTMGRSLKRRPNVYLSRDAGLRWREVQKGNYFYAFGDFGGVIVAVTQFSLTNELLYSKDIGETWHTHLFAPHKIRVYGLLTEPGEKTTVFSIFGSHTGAHNWLILQVNVSDIFATKCDPDYDYKEWSLSDDQHFSGCLLGRKTVFKRRTPHADCYSGPDFQQVTEVKNCSCTRQDYECDLGFMEESPLYTSTGCVIDPEANQTLIHEQPANCPPGTFYRYTKGYRRVAGDTCQGGQQYRYEALMYSCPVEEKLEFLLYSNRHQIHRVELGGTRKDTVLVERFLQNAVALDFDYEDNCLFWADISLDVIKRLCLKNKTQLTTIVYGHLDTVEGLAYDWMGGNLYWVDAALRKIEVAKKDGSFRLVLINGTQHLDKPRAIALDPQNGYMYWTDWSTTNPRIMKCSMDGNASTIQTIVNGSSNVYWPNGLAIDHQLGHLYWTDAHLDRIMRSDLNGQNRVILVNGTSAVPHPYSIAVYKDSLYWSDWSFRAIVSADKLTGQGRSIFMRVNSIMDIKVLNKNSQQGTNPCSQGNAGCSQLCLARPSAQDKSAIYTCRCGGDMLIVKSTTDQNENCVCPNHEPFINNTCMARGNSTCAPHELTCANFKCVPLTWKCDHDDDCGDGSDEKDCGYHDCGSEMFTCANRHCISKNWRCDHDDDCHDGSDERGCTYQACDDQQFSCKNGRCIPKHWHCDLDNDCHDGSDEDNCTLAKTCSPEQIPCGGSGSTCISPAWVCDGGNDCPNATDEQNCHTHTCNPSQFACNNSKCVMASFFCDGHNDCGDGSDEPSSCRTTTSPHPVISSTTPSGPHTCHSWQFQCANEHCLWWSVRCDGVNDCGDFSDEVGCPRNVTTTRAPTTFRYRCQPLEFTCNDGKCLHTRAVCDGFQDCQSGEDEQGCIGKSCGEDYFSCENIEECIKKELVCNGQKECHDGSDEHCNFTTHSDCKLPWKAHCHDSEGCLEPYQMCDGNHQCYDDSDEGSICSRQLRVTQLKASAITSTSLRLQWKAPSAEGNLSYIVAYINLNNDVPVAKNLTASGPVLNITQLTPFSQYRMFVYVKVKYNKTEHVYYPGSPAYFSTKESVPECPDDLLLHQYKLDNDIVLRVIWKEPPQKNGRLLMYKIYYQEAQHKSNVQFKILDRKNFPEALLNGTSYFVNLDSLTMDTKYYIWVTPSNKAGDAKSCEKEKRSVVFGSAYMPPVNPKIKNTTSTSITLTWSHPEKVSGYHILFTNIWHQHVHSSVSKPPITISGLSPGSLYSFVVQPYNVTQNGSTAFIEAKTKGSPLKPPQHLTVDSVGPTSMKVSWTYQANQSFTVFYDYKEHKVSTFTVDGNRVKTNGNSVIINNLLACETYIFAVAVTGPPKSKLSAFSLQKTDADRKAPPKYVQVKSVPDRMTCFNVTWESPCLFNPEYVGYIIEVVEVLGGSPLPPHNSAVPETNATRLSRLLCNGTRGAQYRVRVRTTLLNASFSETASFSIKSYSAPRNFKLVGQSGNNLKFTWNEPEEDLPKDHKYLLQYQENSAEFKDYKSTRESNILFPMSWLQGNNSYTFRILLLVNGRRGESSNEWPFLDQMAAPSMAGSTNLIAIVAPICAVVVILVIILLVYVVRHHRLQRSFLSFARSHYDTRSGTTTFTSDDLGEDEDSPMITGFSDDEPLVLA